MKNPPDIQLEELSWETTASPSPNDTVFVERQPDSSNNANSSVQDVRVVACLARSPEGSLVGGAIARTWGRCCELQQLWVDERAKGKGVGQRLVELVEQEARRRGCSQMYLESAGFQSPEFYHGLGFQTANESVNSPSGSTTQVMQKRLA